MALVVWLCLTTGGIVADFVYASSWLVAIVVAPVVLFVSIMAYGTWRRCRGQLPFNEAEQREDAASVGGIGRHVTTSDGRIVEYIVYGSEKDDAQVMVQMHGAGSSAGLMCLWNAELFKELNLKGIAPSMPNSGYSDIHPTRRIADFPRDDLAPILSAEGVTEFLVDGHSLGTAHAMAVAWFFGPDHADHRCEGMGVNCPYLPSAICKELGFRCDADDFWIIRNNEPRAWHAAWNFALADISNLMPFISPPLAMGHRLWPAFAKARPWAFPVAAEDQKRTGARGYVGQGYEMLCYSINSIWGFDPRDIRTKNVAVWYALDDGKPGCPPEHGKWLAEMFELKGVQISNRSVGIGFGHWTYAPSRGPVYQAAEDSLPKALQQMTRP
eukprot:TRINITY_DN54510_c0_g1_i1.p1 TRINITY_DN54510_c0_g1~~TRINITY_DN54510_c0_g1_i1.p1  ORF type:complete len:422 (+),score=54.20 TRINITY_DN54510_c0_g1_i1:115-1266(+)